MDRIPNKEKALFLQVQLKKTSDAKNITFAWLFSLFSYYVQFWKDMIFTE